MLTDKDLTTISNIFHTLGTADNVAFESGMNALRNFLSSHNVDIRSLRVCNDLSQLLPSKSVSSINKSLRSDHIYIIHLNELLSESKADNDTLHRRVSELEAKLQDAIRPENISLNKVSTRLSKKKSDITEQCMTHLTTELAKIIPDRSEQFTVEHQEFLQQFNLHTIFDRKPVPAIFKEFIGLTLDNDTVIKIRQAFNSSLPASEAHKLYIRGLTNLPYSHVAYPDLWHHIPASFGVASRNWGQQKKINMPWWVSMVIVSGRLQRVLPSIIK